MDFWGVEVKSGEPFPVEPGEGRFVHLSQACLGEVKKDKGSESVYLYVTVDQKKLVLGKLSSEKFPQLHLDLIFNKSFELSHNWKNGSVYFYGYGCDTPFDEIEDDSGESKSQAMREKRPASENKNASKPDSAAAKQKVRIVDPKKDVKTVEEDGSSEDDSDADTSNEDEDSDSESSEGESDDEDEDEETPKEVELSKKRPAKSAIQTPGPVKKAKFVTPQKTDAKKGSQHVATPYPSKQVGKLPANHSKQQTSKPAGSHRCDPCKRSFNSPNALESHTKAKHSAGK